MLARIALVAAALVTGAWLAVSLHWTRLENKARSLVPASAPQRVTPTALVEARRLLERAERHNPSAQPKIVLATLLGITGHNREAAAIYAGVLRDEPSNIEAAAGVYGNVRVYDPAAAAAALRRVRAISPPVSGG